MVNEKLDAIVSLTTWKGRINDENLPKIIVRLLTQKTDVNYKVVLVLSREEFGDDYVLPSELRTLLSSEKFEILWTYKNTKALKKLDPAMKKWPDLPIIVTDDDMLLAENAVAVIWREHLKHPNDILATDVCTPFLRQWPRSAYFKLFPPHSLAELPDEWFEKYFGGLLDDDWNGIRAIVKGTNQRRIDPSVVLDKKVTSQRNRLYNSYRNFPCRRNYFLLKKDHPELGLK